MNELTMPHHITSRPSLELPGRKLLAALTALTLLYPTASWLSRLATRTAAQQVCLDVYASGRHPGTAIADVGATLRPLEPRVMLHTGHRTVTAGLWTTSHTFAWEGGRCRELEN